MWQDPRLRRQEKDHTMNRDLMNAETAFAFTSDGKLRARLFRGSLALLAAVCLLILPPSAKAACGSFGAPGLNNSIQLPVIAQAELGFPARIERVDQPIVGLWHVTYTNSADQSTFNDTFDTWHSDGTEFEIAFLAPAGGNVCAGVWRQTGLRSVTLHHVGWLFNPATPTATATNIFTLDENVTVARDGASYSGSFTFKIWNLDGTPTKVEVQGTIAATRITVN
jgi:hypothetical protein